jgi:ATP-dependent exoDNAse (exonuclease V) beta subunit
MENPHDDTAWMRVVNFPARGIGARTLEQQADIARTHGVSLYSAVAQVPGRGGNNLAQFASLVDQLRFETQNLPLHEIVDHVIDASGLVPHYLQEKEGAERVENLRELVNAAAAFASEGGYARDDAGALSQTLPETDIELPSPLAGFLSHAALEAGDNQAGDGQDAVQLMTVHAAKGLEFEAVFISGLEEGLFPHENSILEQAGLEEERRLMYVAVTRARDRLYLSGEVDGRGKLVNRPTSLSSLLPPGLAAQFSPEATLERDHVEWATAEGTFAFRVCRPPAEAIALDPETQAAPAPLDVGPIAPAAPAVVSATDLFRPATNTVPADTPAARRAAGSDRLVGTLVHRLMARTTGGSDEDLLAAARAVLSPVELGEIDQPGPILAMAVDLYRALARQPEVTELLGSGRAWYEVPFSYQRPERPSERVRGSIDCVIERKDGQFVVLEFKTGRPRPEHQAQVDLYVAALGQALDTNAISAKIVYP